MRTLAGSCAAPIRRMEPRSVLNNDVHGVRGAPADLCQKAPAGFQAHAVGVQADLTQPGAIAAIDPALVAATCNLGPTGMRGYIYHNWPVPPQPNTSGLSRQIPVTVVGAPYAATIPVASPAVITTPAQTFAVDDAVSFTTTGTLPAGLITGQTYYVLSTGLTTTTIRVSLTKGGAAINTTADGSGVHTVSVITPAFGIMAKDDVILGVSAGAGTPVPLFTDDARKTLGMAITAAEAGDGKLNLKRWRAGVTTDVTLQLAIMGTYSAINP